MSTAARSVTIPAAGGAALPADLVVPPAAHGLVVFAHGSGSSRHSGRRPDHVVAVVSRGGPPDLAGDALADVRAPTLLLVGGRDEQVLELNRQAGARLRAPWRLEVVPGATHLFEEPGALDAVADLAGAFFDEHLPTTPTTDGRP